MKVSVAEAKNKLPELIKAVETGETVTICRRGLPVVDLVRTAVSSSQGPRFGSLAGRIIVHDSDWWRAMSEDEAGAFVDDRD